MPHDERWSVLEMAEGLINAHQAAKVDGDQKSIDLIEVALFYVGRRLAEESGEQFASFRRKLSGHGQRTPSDEGA